MYTTIGKFNFLTQTLTELTELQAKERFSHIDPRIVSNAWKLANPNGRKKRKKQ